MGAGGQDEGVVGEIHPAVLEDCAGVGHMFRFSRYCAAAAFIRAVMSRASALGMGKVRA